MTAMNRSAKAARMERRHKKAGAASLNLTSLMDIFTILVFFLLVNSSNTQQLPDDPNIVLPKSVAEEVPEETLKVMVSDIAIIVEGMKVMSSQAALEQEDDDLAGLTEELEIRKSRTRRTKLPDGTLEELQVTIMADREIPFKLIKRVMRTCALAEYTKISFAVLRDANKGNGGAE